MILSLPEPDALLFAYRMERSGRRSALEEGWLLKELGSVHGMSREVLSRALLRSESLISRRLSLVTVLPPFDSGGGAPRGDSTAGGDEVLRAVGPGQPGTVRTALWSIWMASG